MKPQEKAPPSKWTMRLAQLISKHSLLPATLFTKPQLSTMESAFHHFWGLSSETAELDFGSPRRFSTFTLGAPINLWSYYFSTLQEVEIIRATYSIVPFKVTTEDHVILSGTYFKHNTPHPHTRTMIVFGGNGELYKMGSAAWLFKLLQHSQIPFNIVMFDPRGCGNSQGIAHAQGLVIDGETIYQYVHQTLGISEDRIDLCGFSLGGAIATLVKANHPDTQGVLISNRSFHSLDRAVHNFFTPLSAKIAQFFGKAAVKMTRQSGWMLNPFEAWKTISSRKMVICHEEDPVVRYPASLEYALSQENLLETCLHIRLKQKNPAMAITNHHVQPLNFYNDHRGCDVEHQILSFLIEGVS